MFISYARSHSVSHFFSVCVPVCMFFSLLLLRANFVDWFDDGFVMVYTLVCMDKHSAIDICAAFF